MPVLRSANRRAVDAASAIAVRRPSSTTKSLPRPCILRNGILPIAAAYMAARVSCPTPAQPRVSGDALHDWAAHETISLRLRCPKRDEASFVNIVSSPPRRRGVQAGPWQGTGGQPPRPCLTGFPLSQE